MAAQGGVPRQVDVGGIVGVGDAARAVPRLIGHVGMAGMVARNDAAAVAVGVVIRSLGREGSIRFAADRALCVHCFRRTSRFAGAYRCFFRLALSKCRGRHKAEHHAQSEQDTE